MVLKSRGRNLVFLSFRALSFFLSRGSGCPAVWRKKGGWWHCAGKLVQTAPRVGKSHFCAGPSSVKGIAFSLGTPSGARTLGFESSVGEKGAPRFCRPFSVCAGLMLCRKETIDSSFSSARGVIAHAYTCYSLVTTSFFPFPWLVTLLLPERMPNIDDEKSGNNNRKSRLFSPHRFFRLPLP